MKLVSTEGLTLKKVSMLPPCPSSDLLTVNTLNLSTKFSFRDESINKAGDEALWRRAGPPCVKPQFGSAPQRQKKEKKKCKQEDN